MRINYAVAIYTIYSVLKNIIGNVETDWRKNVSLLIGQDIDI